MGDGPMDVACTEFKWLVALLKDLQCLDIRSTALFCDNQSALHIAQNPVFHESTKHIEVDFHFMRDMVIAKQISPSYVPTTFQFADLYVHQLKLTSMDSLSRFLSKMGVINLYSTPS